MKNKKVEFKLQYSIADLWYYDISWAVERMDQIPEQDRLAWIVAYDWYSKLPLKGFNLTSVDTVIFKVDLIIAMALLQIINNHFEDDFYLAELQDTKTLLSNFVKEELRKKTLLKK